VSDQVESELIVEAGLTLVFGASAIVREARPPETRPTV
jgi:hypothetical protein